MYSAHRDVRPPKPPWIPLEYHDEKAALSYYYSDSNTNVPIRDVSNRNDPKPDPNVETMTYGLFSYCHRQMRKSIVDNGIELLFFCTQRREKYIEENLEKYRTKRVLTGYYRIGWYYEVENGDFMLAARAGRFVNPGFLLDELPPYLRGDRINTWFRSWKYLYRETPKLLLILIDQTPDATGEYISEIRHLEKEALNNYDYMYRNRTEGFSWEDAPRPMKMQ